MSRSIEALIVEALSVSRACIVATAFGLGSASYAAAIARHSARSSSAMSGPASAAFAGPTGARMRQVSAASEASWTHFDHMSRRISALRRLFTLSDLAKEAGSASQRGELAPV